jgi:hypothetical protein
MIYLVKAIDACVPAVPVKAQISFRYDEGIGTGGA